MHTLRRVPSKRGVLLARAYNGARTFSWQTSLTFCAFYTPCAIPSARMYSQKSQSSANRTLRQKMLYRTDGHPRSKRAGFWTLLLLTALPFALLKAHAFRSEQETARDIMAAYIRTALFTRRQVDLRDMPALYAHMHTIFSLWRPVALDAPNLANMCATLEILQAHPDPQMHELFARACLVLVPYLRDLFDQASKSLNQTEVGKDTAIAMLQIIFVPQLEIALDAAEMGMLEVVDVQDEHASELSSG